MIKDGDKLVQAINWRNKCLNWLKAVNGVEYGNWLHWIEYVKLQRN